MSETTLREYQEFPDYFIMSSETILRKINFASAAVFGIIYNLSKELGYCYMSQKEICRQLGIDKNTLTDNINILLGKSETRKKKPNKYYTYINENTCLLVEIPHEFIKHPKPGKHYYAPHMINFRKFIEKYKLPDKNKIDIYEDENKNIQKWIFERMYGGEKVSLESEKVHVESEKVSSEGEKVQEESEKVSLKSEKVPEECTKSPQIYYYDTNQNTKKDTTEQTREKTSEPTTPASGGSESTSFESESKEDELQENDDDWGIPEPENDKEVEKPVRDSRRFIEIQNQFMGMVKKYSAEKKSRITKAAKEAGIETDFSKMNDEITLAMKFLNFVIEFSKKEQKSESSKLIDIDSITVPIMAQSIIGAELSQAEKQGIPTKQILDSVAILCPQTDYKNMEDLNNLKQLLFQIREYVKKHSNTGN